MLLDLFISLILAGVAMAPKGSQSAYSVIQQSVNAPEIPKVRVFARLPEPEEKNVVHISAEQGATAPVQRARVPVKNDERNFGIKLESRAAAIVDFATGTVLFSHNPFESVPFASLTKLATALTFLHTNPDFGKIVTMQESDERNGGKVNVYRGERYTVSDLLHIALIKSDNNAAMALVHATTLTDAEFVEQMNAFAGELYVKGTRFTDPTGLDMNNMSTAISAAKLFAETLRTPLITEVISKPSYTFSPENSSVLRTITSTNQILGHTPYGLSVVAGKTGTLAGRYNLAISAESDNGERMIVVILGAPTDATRYSEALKLAAWTFENYTWN